VVDGVQQVQQLERLVAAAEARESHHHPERGVRVLASVLAQPRRIGGDVAGVGLRRVEGRVEQQDQLGGALHEVGAHGVHRLLGSAGGRPTREHSPALRHGVDPALLVLLRPERRAVVEVRAPVPLAVPRQLQHVGEPVALRPVARRARAVAARLAERGEGAQDEEQEPADEDALAAAVLADGVHAVVPVAAAHERQPVRPDGQAAVDRTQAVLEERRLLLRHGGLEVGLELAGRQRLRLEEGDLLVQDRVVAGDLEVAQRRVGKEEEVVRAARARALAAARVPPVLHVALAELPRGGEQQLGAQQRWVDDSERHRVLQLVAEADRAARLVVARARPDAAGQRLVDQPAVQHDVERVVGRAHLHGAEPSFPERLDREPLALGGAGSGQPVDERLGVRAVVALAEQEHDGLARARRELERRLERGARVEARPKAAQQLGPAQRRRARERAVAADELGAIARRERKRAPSAANATRAAKSRL
jgi:hypothetical protein